MTGGAIFLNKKITLVTSFNKLKQIIFYSLEFFWNHPEFFKISLKYTQFSGSFLDFQFFLIQAEAF